MGLLLFLGSRKTRTRTNFFKGATHPSLRNGDPRFNGSGWSFHDFRGDRWCNVASPDNQRYLRNAYRVLLTRARQGMVILSRRAT
ncbi:MAG: DNA/RNA helicase domain-containing protein [Candidatus Binatia bacterium]